VSVSSKSLGLGVVILAMLPTATRAQSCGRVLLNPGTFMAYAQRRAAAGVAAFVRAGYRASAEDGWMCGQDTVDVPLLLEPGTQYAIVAGCDQDCGDLDVVVRRGDGTVIAADTERFDSPRLPRIRAPDRSEEGTIEIRMGFCSSRPCAWAMRVLERPAAFRGFAPVSQARRQVAARAGALVRRGYRLTHSASAPWLRSHHADSVYRTLRPGTQYAVVAACASACQDLDLVVTGPEGKLSGADTSSDATPSVHFLTDSAIPATLTSDDSAAHTIEVRMRACKSEPCAWAIGILERPATVALRQARRRVAERATALSGQDLRVVDSAEVGWLRNHQSTLVLRTLRPATLYAVAAACNQDCTGLDILVRGPDTAVSESDSAPEAAPSVRLLTAAQLAGEHAIEVRMRACVAEPCAWALRILEGTAGGGAPAGPSRARLRVTHLEPRWQPVRIGDSLVGHTPVTVEVPAGRVFVQVGRTRLCLYTNPDDSGLVAMRNGALQELRAAMLCGDSEGAAARDRPRRQPGAAPRAFLPRLAGGEAPPSVTLARRGLMLVPRGLVWDSLRPGRYAIELRASGRISRHYESAHQLEVSVAHRRSGTGGLVFLRYDRGSLTNVREGTVIALPLDSAGIPTLDTREALSGLPVEPVTDHVYDHELESPAFDGLVRCLQWAEHVRRLRASSGAWPFELDTIGIPAFFPSNMGRERSRLWLRLWSDSTGEVVLAGHADNPAAGQAEIYEDRFTCRFASDGVLTGYSRLKEVFNRNDPRIREVWYRQETRLLGQGSGPPVAR